MKKKIFISRKNPRIKSRIKADFRSGEEQEGAFRDGIITNFSRSGLFVATEALLEPGVTIEINVYLPEEEEKVSLEGTVVNRKKGEETGMGVEISLNTIKKQDKKKLMEFFDLNNIYGWFC